MPAVSVRSETSCPRLYPAVAPDSPRGERGGRQQRHHVQASASCQAEAKADVSQRRSSPFLFTGEALAPKKSPGVGELRSVIPGLISIGFLLAAFLLGEGTSAW